MSSPTAISAQASKVLRDAGVSKPPIDLNLVASYNQVDVYEQDLKGLADGMLTFVGAQPVIAVEEKMMRERRRFTIAHEFGHYFLPDHEGAFQCFMNDLRSRVDSPFEAEANSFAVELLMPENLFNDACLRLPLGFTSICALASNFEVSITSCAWRFVSYRRERCALAFCKKEGLKWFASSPSFPTRSLKFNRGAPVHKQTIVYDYLQGLVKESKPAKRVLATSWFPACEDLDLMVWEECFSAPDFGFVLSLLSFEAEDVLGSEDEEDY